MIPTDIWPSDAPERCALTIGVFDGVHIGHAAIIARCRRLAEEDGVPAVALTFDRPPEYVVAPERAQDQLVSLSRRVELLRRAGADEVVVLGFDAALARVTAEDFAAALMGSAHLDGIVVGENFRFGAGGAGDPDLLRSVGESFRVPVLEEPLVELGGEAVSSTRIRALLEAGDIDAAHLMLGRAPELEGIVVRGAGRGRELGYPTANLAVPEGLITPAEGVYAGRAFWAHRTAGAAVSIGGSPTFKGAGRFVEAYLLDVSEELLGQQVRLELLKRLRSQERFESPEALAAAIAEDVAATRSLLERVSRGRAADLPE